MAVFGLDQQTLPWFSMTAVTALPRVFRRPANNDNSSSGSQSSFTLGDVLPYRVWQYLDRGVAFVIIIESVVVSLLFRCAKILIWILQVRRSNYLFPLLLSAILSWFINLYVSISFVVQQRERISISLNSEITNWKIFLHSMETRNGLY